MKIALKSIARAAFHYGGGTWATRLRNRNGARILMYHRFPAQSQLEAQCEHLKKFYRPVPLTDVGNWLTGEQKLPAQSVVFTVDDGYRDFFLNAFPILSSYAIPAIVYLATDMLDQRRCLWVDWVKILFSACLLEDLKLDLPQRGSVRFPLLSAQQKATAAWETKETLKLVSNAERLGFLDRLPALLRLSRTPACPDEYAPLSWNEVRQMSQAGIEFGAHTKSHPILSRLDSFSQILEELAGSKARIEQELDQPVRHFCYPNGHWSDITPSTLAAVHECGFLTAVTAEKGVNFLGADRFKLTRIHQEPTTPPLQFAHQVAGLAR